MAEKHLTSAGADQPTRYLIQERFLSLDNRFTITDEAGLVRYRVTSSFFAMGDKLRISNADGKELMKVRQDTLHLHLTYKIYSTSTGETEREIASIKRTGAMWQHKLQISSIHGDYVMEKTGGAASNEFQLLKDDRTVASITKDPVPAKSLYWVDITDSDEHDHVLILALVIVLSCAQRLPVNPMIKPDIKTPATD